MVSGRRLILVSAVAGMGRPSLRSIQWIAEASLPQLRRGKLATTIARHFTCLLARQSPLSSRCTHHPVFASS